jgi:hypothetical protein
LSEEAACDGEGCCGCGEWGIAEVNMTGLLLEGESHEKKAIEVDGLSMHSVGAFTGDMFSADFGDEYQKIKTIVANTSSV